MTRGRSLTFVQKRIAEVRAARLALYDRAAAREIQEESLLEIQEESPRLVDVVVTSSHGRALLRGEIEPEVIVAEDGTVRLAPLEWSTVASDMTEQ